MMKMTFLLGLFCTRLDGKFDGNVTNVNNIGDVMFRIVLNERDVSG
jgi:hypothetical protein